METLLDSRDKHILAQLSKASKKGRGSARERESAREGEAERGREGGWNGRGQTTPRQLLIQAAVCSILVDRGAFLGQPYLCDSGSWRIDPAAVGGHCDVSSSREEKRPSNAMTSSVSSSRFPVGTRFLTPDTLARSRPRPPVLGLDSADNVYTTECMI